MKKIQTALVSVFYKDGLEEIIQVLHANDVTIYSTGGTQSFIEKLGVPCIPVDTITGFPEILGGRVKTLHPVVFGGILGRRDDSTHIQQMEHHSIPQIDMVIVDLYPFEETVSNGGTPQQIIEKIDIGGPSMLRAAAKNHADVLVVASKKDYANIGALLTEQACSTELAQRRSYAIKAFDVCTQYDTAISAYFHESDFTTAFNKKENTLRYGENPHQQAVFYGELDEVFTQLHGKALSYNNLVDVAAALDLMADLSPEFPTNQDVQEYFFAIIKHTNVCGAAQRPTLEQSWTDALAGDPESAFGGVLITNGIVDEKTALSINEIFFEVLMAPGFTPEALAILQQKKNRILLEVLQQPKTTSGQKNVLGGILIQQSDDGNFSKWEEAGGRSCTPQEQDNLKFANIICKHLKSNAIALVQDLKLLGKGCGQTSRVDALRHALEKAKQFDTNLQGAVLASDAFFPFDDCVKLAHAAGISAFIQPGGSLRDGDSIKYCKENNLPMVMTGLRHFKH